MTTQPADHAPTPELTTDEVIGERVHLRMFRSRVTQTRMAADLGMQQSALSRKLRGQRPWLAAELVQVATVLGVTPADLLPDGMAASPPRPAGPSTAAAPASEATTLRKSLDTGAAVIELPSLGRAA